LADWAQAAEHFEHAAEHNAAMGTRPWVAHTEHDFARMLVARDAPADRARANELLGSARAACEELGMTALGAKVTTLLEGLEAGRPAEATLGA
jgi:hypothetical protein